MAFTSPQGLNFRSTLSYVTDGADDYFIGSGQTYPTTTTQGSTVGWSGTGVLNFQNRNSALDARLAGIVFVGAAPSPAFAEFRVDTGAGAFDIRLAVGDATNGHTNYRVQFFDGSGSTLHTVSGTSVGAAHWVDATGVERTSASDWTTNNAAKSLTLANTFLRMQIGTGPSGSGDFTCVSHLRIDAAAGGGTTFQPAWAFNASRLISGGVSVS